MVCRVTNPPDRQLPIDPGAVPVAPGLEDSVANASDGSAAFRAPREYAAIDRRTIGICAGAVVVAIGAALAAQLLIRLIGLVTNATFFGRLSTDFSAPRFGTHNPWLIIAIPVGGAIIVGLMARYGSAAIRGHGIPEVMERVLYGESRIPARVLFLKPISAAIAIGTGGPFGAEGPIIATGGALGSLAGQIFHITADERKTLLAAGAAAGMAATFGNMFRDAQHAPKPGEHPGMHRTDTVDYALMLEGELIAIMDEGETPLRAGDVLIQRGTNHAWANRSGKPARIAFVLIDAGR